MSRMFSDRATVPGWAVVLGLLGFSPAPMAFPSGTALLAMGLIGSALLFHRSSRPGDRTIAMRHRAQAGTARTTGADETDLDRMGSDAG
jgi:hypothetical protein